MKSRNHYKYWGFGASVCLGLKPQNWGEKEQNTKSGTFCFSNACFFRNPLWALFTTFQKPPSGPFLPQNAINEWLWLIFTKAVLGTYKQFLPCNIVIIFVWFWVLWLFFRLLILWFWLFLMSLVVFAVVLLVLLFCYCWSLAVHICLVTATRQGIIGDKQLKTSQYKTQQHEQDHWHVQAARKVRKKGGVGWGAGGRNLPTRWENKSHDICSASCAFCYCACCCYFCCCFCVVLVACVVGFWCYCCCCSYFLLSFVFWLVVSVSRSCLVVVLFFENTGFIVFRDTSRNCLFQLPSLFCCCCCCCCFCCCFWFASTVAVCHPSVLDW